MKIPYAGKSVFYVPKIFSYHSNGHTLVYSRIHSFTVHFMARQKKTTINLSLVGIPPEFEPIIYQIQVTSVVA